MMLTDAEIEEAVRSEIEAKFAARTEAALAENTARVKYQRQYAMGFCEWLHTPVFRGGTKTDHWHSMDAARGGVVAVGQNREDYHDPALCFGFTITAGGRGGGDTNIKVEIKPQHFPTLLAMMAEADREATLKAMADEIKPKHFPTLLRMMAKTDREATLRAMADELRF